MGGRGEVVVGCVGGQGRHAACEVHPGGVEGEAGGEGEGEGHVLTVEADGGGGWGWG